MKWIYLAWLTAAAGTMDGPFIDGPYDSKEACTAALQGIADRHPADELDGVCVEAWTFHRERKEN